MTTPLRTLAFQQHNAAVHAKRVDDRRCLMEMSDDRPSERQSEGLKMCACTKSVRSSASFEPPKRGGRTLVCTSSSRRDLQEKSDSGKQSVMERSTVGQVSTGVDPVHVCGNFEALTLTFRPCLIDHRRYGGIRRDIVTSGTDFRG